MDNRIEVEWQYEKHLGRDSSHLMLSLTCRPLRSWFRLSGLYGLESIYHVPHYILYTNLVLKFTYNVDTVIHFNNVHVLAFIDEVNQFLFPFVGSPFYYFIHCLSCFVTHFTCLTHSASPCMFLFCCMQHI